MKARFVAALGALIAAFLVLIPLPFSDLFVMVPMQFGIAAGVLLVTGRPLKPLSLGRGVLGYALLGVLLSFILCNFTIPFLGRFFAVPFAFVWCYGLGELTLLTSAPKR